ncbi:hypothetical protein IKG20_02150 [Candidatus Saccharibacteria bacterium]|nr:hypothetical protein [Candidatus Saccharibacteria bacterium]
MEILACLVVIVLALAGIGLLSGDGGRAYDDYRRAEYRNEYLWETRQRSSVEYCDRALIGVRHT